MVAGGAARKRRSKAEENPLAPPGLASPALASPTALLHCSGRHVPPSLKKVGGGDPPTRRVSSQRIASHIDRFLLRPRPLPSRAAPRYPIREGGSLQCWPAIRADQSIFPGTFPPRSCAAWRKRSGDIESRKSELKCVRAIGRKRARPPVCRNRVLWARV